MVYHYDRWNLSVQYTLFMGVPSNLDNLYSWLCCVGAPCINLHMQQFMFLLNTLLSKLTAE